MIRRQDGKVCSPLERTASAAPQLHRWVGALTGERVRCYWRLIGSACSWRIRARRLGEGDRWDYDVEHYLQLLVTSCASRLRKAFAPQDWQQLFRLDAQLGLWDQPLDRIEPLWIQREPNKPLNHRGRSPQ